MSSLAEQMGMNSDDRAKLDEAGAILATCDPDNPPMDKLAAAAEKTVEAMKGPRTLDRVVPDNQKAAVEGLKALLLRELVPVESDRANLEVRLYGTFLGDADQPLYRVDEIDIGNERGGSAIQNCVPENLGILRACEDWLETYAIAPWRPEGWESYLDVHADAEFSLIHLLRSPSPETIKGVVRAVLACDDENPNLRIRTVLNRKYPANATQQLRIRSVLERFVQPVKESHGS